MACPPTPPDLDWWFPPYVPAWARMLPRSIYEGALKGQRDAWIAEYKALLEQWRVAKEKSRGPGRPKDTTSQEDWEFYFTVHRAWVEIQKSGKKPGIPQAIRRAFPQGDTERLRARLNRIRKSVRNLGLAGGLFSTKRK